jgi:hypothetical protein
VPTGHPIALHTDRPVTVIPAWSAGVQRPGRAVTILVLVSEIPPFPGMSYRGKFWRNDEPSVTLWGHPSKTRRKGRPEAIIRQRAAASDGKAWALGAGPSKGDIGTFSYCATGAAC